MTDTAASDIPAMADPGAAMASDAMEHGLQELRQALGPV